MIGIFDSGVGGLSVFKEIYTQLPDNKYIYVSDNGYCPYGPRPREEVISRAVSITEYLISKGAQLIVVACNTATAAAIDYLRQNYSIPFVGMEPAIKPAAIHSRSAVVGVLATRGTFKGELYLKTSSKFAANVEVLEQVGEGLVELVESGETHSQKAYSLLSKYLTPMIEKGADHLVLGCTHYPFLTDVIKDIVGDKMQIINPAPAIAKRVEEILLAEKICETKEGTNTFVTTGINIALVQKMVGDISLELLNNSKFDTIVL